jgi:hypothetical protein
VDKTLVDTQIEYSHTRKQMKAYSKKNILLVAGVASISLLFLIITLAVTLTGRDSGNVPQPLPPNPD